MTYKFILLVADWLRVAVNGRVTVTKTKNYICMRRYKLISTHANYRNVYESCVCLHEQFQQTNLTWYADCPFPRFIHTSKRSLLFIKMK